MEPTELSVSELLEQFSELTNHNPKPYKGNKPVLIHMSTGGGLMGIDGKVVEIQDLTPLVNELANQYGDQIECYVVDVENAVDKYDLPDHLRSEMLVLLPTNDTPQWVSAYNPQEFIVKLVKQYLLGEEPGDDDETDQDEEAMMEMTYDDFLEYIANPAEGGWNYRGDKPSIVVFYGTESPSCAKMMPLLEELAQEYSDSIDVYKVDADEEDELSDLCGIRAVPSMLFAPMNAGPKMVVALKNKEELRELIENILL